MWTFRYIPRTIYDTECTQFIKLMSKLFVVLHYLLYTIHIFRKVSLTNMHYFC